MKTPNIPPAAEKARKEMQEHYDAQVFTRDLWETLHGATSPKQHDLQTMLVRQLKKHQAAIRATITALRYGGDPLLELADKLERLL